jgi:hypothetical protein
MAELAKHMPTLIDVARILAPDGSIGSIAEILSEENEILDDIPWYEGNLPTGHQLNIRTSKPTPTFRLLNEGVVPVKATTGQIVEGCAIMETRNHTDKNLAELNGNTAAFRLSQDRAFIASMGETLANTMVYGDISVNPERFNGLASRYFSISGETTSAQIIDAGGTGSDNTSVWLVAWGPGKVYGIYPKGSRAGLDHQDLGIQEVITNTTTGATLRAYVSWFQWLCGIAVEDYRYVVRICNIDASDLATVGDTSDTSANLFKYMSLALDMLPSGSSNPVFYMNKTTRAYLRVKLMNKTNVHLTLEQVVNGMGTKRPTLYFDGVPCRRIDKLTSAESRIT